MQATSWEKQSRSLAYTLDNNLYVTTADGSTRTVTKEEKELFADSLYTAMSLASTKGRSGVLKVVCWHFTAWMNAW